MLRPWDLPSQYRHNMHMRSAGLFVNTLWESMMLCPPGPDITFVYMNEIMNGNSDCNVLKKELLFAMPRTAECCLILWSKHWDVWGGDKCLGPTCVTAPMKGPILPLEVDSAVEYSNRHSVPARLSPAEIVQKP